MHWWAAVHGPHVFGAADGDQRCTLTMVLCLYMQRSPSDHPIPSSWLVPAAQYCSHNTCSQTRWQPAIQVGPVSLRCDVRHRGEPSAGEGCTLCTCKLASGGARRRAWCRGRRRLRRAPRARRRWRRSGACRAWAPRPTPRRRTSRRSWRSTTSRSTRAGRRAPAPAAMLAPWHQAVAARAPRSACRRAWHACGLAPIGARAVRRKGVGSPGSHFAVDLPLPGMPPPGAPPQRAVRHARRVCLGTAPRIEATGCWEARAHGG